MDIPALSTALSQVSLSQQVSVAMLRKTMDTSEAQTQSLMKMMEMSINPDIGGNIDIRV